MPRPIGSRVGAKERVPAGLDGKCRVCERTSITDGTEVSEVLEDQFFNGKFSTPTGKVVFKMQCPYGGCDGRVEYRTDQSIYY